MLMQSPFDIMAETYDTDFTHTNIGQLQRKRVWEFLLPVLESYQRPLRILEINCGTGEDALELSRLGHSVSATDASEMMISKAQQKAALTGKTTVNFQVCSFDHLNSQFAEDRFDLVFSNFGGLNCIGKRDLEKLGQQLSQLLKNDGKLFFVIMGNLCLWEIFYFSIRGKFRTAFRRRRRSVLFQTGEAGIPVFYYSPENLKKIFKPIYTHCSSHPVGLFIPPSYLEKTSKARKGWLNKLVGLENRIGGLTIFSNLADHFCIIFQKKEIV